MGQVGDSGGIVPPSGAGNITSITGTSPVNVTAGNTPVVSINAAGITGGNGTGQLAANTVDIANLAGDARANINLLTNPGFNFCQFQAPGTLTTIANQGYACDGWISERPNTDVQYIRVSNSGSTGFNSANRGRFKKITNAGRLVIYQPLSSVLSQSFFNQNATFQVSLNLPVNYKFRIMFIQWVGAADAITGSPLISDFTTSPMTLNANYSIMLNSSLINPGTGLTQWNLNISGMNNNIVNLIVAITIEDTISINDTIEVCEAGLYVNSGLRSGFSALSDAEDRARCEFFYEKTHDIDTNPSTSTATGAIETVIPVSNQAVNIPVRYRGNKIKTPAITFRNPNNGVAGTFRDTTGAADITPTTGDIGLRGFSLSYPNTITAAHIVKGHLEIDGRL